jgi:hypothetical protein
VQTTDKGIFLIVEDFGTWGLTGENMEYEEVLSHSQADDLKKDQRLARIESVWNSGGNVGPGLFGIGKFVYSAMSEGKQPLYYFDSKLDGGEYRANVNLCGRLRYPALEGNEAAALIKEDIGLDPISHVGTRFIIARPKKEAVDDVQNGTMAAFVGDTWWRLFDRFDKDGGIFVQHKKVEMPDTFSLVHNTPKHSWVNTKIEEPKPGFKVKNFGFFILNDKIEDPNLRGIYFYRKGMKIVDFPCELIPDSIRDNCFGYIELDKDWEDLMEKVEDMSHYDIQGPKHHTNQVVYLKDYINAKVKELLLSWGYIKENKGGSRFGNDFDDFVKNEVAEELENLGYQPLGKGEEPDRINFRLSNVTFPHPEEERTVYDRDKITLDYSLKNLNSAESHFEVTFKTFCLELDDKELKSETRELEALPEVTALGHFSITIDPSNSEKNLANTLEITVRQKGGKKALATRKIVYYYATPTVKDPVQDFSFYCKHIGWPKIASKRVNTGDQISDLAFYVANNTDLEVPMLLTLSTHNGEDRNARIDELPPLKFILKPGEDLVTQAQDIVFSAEKYLPRLKKGKVEVRARLFADGRVGSYRNQELIGKFFFTAYFNCDNKTGNADAFTIHTFDYPPDVEKRCSWITYEDGKYVIYINLAYPEINSLEDEDEQKKQVLREALFQAQVMYIMEGHFEQLRYMDKDIDRTNPGAVISAIKRVSDTIWWKKCQK